MCGIVGVRRFDGANVDIGLLRAMNERLSHRGPDATGYWVSGSTGFGHSRLSIIDLGGPAQPLSTPDGRQCVCFNGEILNYKDVRKNTSNYEYRTQGDTEVLLAAYRAHGADMVHELEGQFAFAICDLDSTDLLLVRDRLGVLPLYFYVDETTFAFASEVKALWPAVPNRPEIDAESLNDYLALRSVSAPYTLFKDVRKLPPGHLMRVGRGGVIETKRYWGIPASAVSRWDQSSSPVRRMTLEMERAVESALVADAPVGAYLSGGVDSSLICALMSKLRAGAPVLTFAAGFGDPRHDELPYARQVSELLGTEHHEVVMQASDLTDLLHPLTWHRDAPMSEPADFAVHRLAQLAGEKVKVVLSGEGSDELFAGYPKYAAAPVVERFARLPAAVRRGLFEFVDGRVPIGASRIRVPTRVLGETHRDERIRAWFAPFTARERADLVGQWGQHEARLLSGVDGDLVRQMLAVDCQTWLPDNLLERGDRMTMSASVEMRPPFLDHRLVELAFSVPTSLKIRGATTKWIVKEVARQYLPAEIVDRRKVGFRVPLDSWFRGDLHSMAWDMLTSSDSLASSMMDGRSVRRLLNRHRSGRWNEEIRIWTLLSLEVWHNVFFRNLTHEPWQVSPKVQ